MNILEQSNLLSIAILVFNVVYALVKSTAKKDTLRRKFKLVLTEKQKGPFLYRIFTAYYTLKQMIKYSMLIELLYFYISNQIIKQHQTSIRHSALYDNINVYSDYNSGFDYYQQMLLSFIIQVIMISLVSNKITINLQWQLQMNSFVTVVKIILDCQRLIKYQKIVIGISIVQIIYDSIILLLLLYLFLYSSHLQHLSTFINQQISDNQNNIYEEYNEKFQDQEDEQIIKQTDRLLKAFNTFHMLKNIRQNLKDEIEKGRDFIIVFVIAISLFFYLTNFKELRSLYTNNKPLFDSQEINRLQNPQLLSLTAEQMKVMDNWISPNVVVYILSGVSYKQYQQTMNKNIDTRIYKLNQIEKTQSSATNWMALFSGTTPQINGLYGNTLNVNQNKVDNIFNYINSDSTTNFMVFGNDFFEDFCIQAFGNVRASQHFKQTKFKSIIRDAGYRNLTKEQKINQFIAFYEKMYSNDIDLSKGLQEFNVQLKNKINQIIEKIKKKDDKKMKEYYNELDKMYQKLVKDKKLAEQYIKAQQMMNQNYFLIFQDDDLLKNQNSFQQTLARKQEEIKKMMDSLQDNTILIVTSDQSNDLSIPFQVYKKDSKLNDNKYSQSSKSKEYNIVDVAATISALIGNEIPKLNQGQFIDEVVQLNGHKINKINYFQLYEQQVNFLNVFFDKYGVKINEFQKLLSQDRRVVSQLDKEYYNDRIQYMKHIFNEQKKLSQASNIQLNMNKNTIILVVIQLLIFMMFQSFSFIDLASLLQSVESQSKEMNIFAAKKAVIIYLIYLAINMALFNIYCFANGYFEWDLNIVNSALSIGNYLILVIFVPLIINLLVIKYLFFYFSISEDYKKNSNNNAFHQQDADINSRDDKYTPIKYGRLKDVLQINNDLYQYQQYGIGKLYLVRMYLILIGLIVGFLILFVQGTITDIFDPYHQQSGFINQNLLNFRFTIIYYSFVNIILLLMQIYSLYVWPEWSLTRQIFDSIYLLREFKVTKIFALNQMNYKSDIYHVFVSQFVNNHTNIDNIKNQKQLIEKYNQYIQNKPNEEPLNILYNDETLRKTLLKQVFLEIHKIDLDVDLQSEKNFDNESQALQQAVYEVFVKFKQMYRTASPKSK